jgi:P-type Ca2+ transporter type 2C
MDINQTSWHVLSENEAAQQLKSSSQNGLSAPEAARRLAHFGPNTLNESQGRPLWRMALDQFSDFMILVLIVAAVISGVIGDPEDTIVIVLIVILNAIIGFVQEYRAECAISALKRLSETVSRVVRDNQIETVSTAELVPGDVVLLEAGNLVPADLRIVETAHIRIDESSLTGESVAIDKQTNAVRGSDLPLGDRHCMAYKGTNIVHGRGRGLVVATGMQSELGKIAALISDARDTKTPLQNRLSNLGKRLALAALGICGVVFILGIIRGEPLLLMFMTAISLAVAAIPEALPAVVTISLALGARKMVKQHALIRRLPAVETLGSVTFICSDKTGTLTQNKMQAATIYADDRLESDLQLAQPSEPWSTLFQALALNNDAHLDNHSKVQGEPTEVALLEAAQTAGFDKEVLEQEMPRIRELPFDSERQRMTTFHRTDSIVIAFTKGSPEAVVSKCNRSFNTNEDIDRTALLGTAGVMAAEGLRVLAFAYRSWPELPVIQNPEELESELVFLGFVGLIDPPRLGVKEAVALCKSAGITPVMITGDHPATAGAIARELGILLDNDKGIMTGPELARLDQAEFQSVVEKVRVYARVDPTQKIRIVEALQDKGEIVAMTGDGVNDAPALKVANIGIAMGKGGTDVAREAAHMVLLDDNFTTIVQSIRQGRRLYDNIRKFIRYAVTTNSAEILTILLAPLLGLPIPLLPIHILWINLVTDGLPSLALTSEPAERGVMRRPPRPPQESIFAHGMWQHIVWVGLLMTSLTLLIQSWAYHSDSTHWQTMVFTVLTLAQLANVLAIRSEKESLFSIGPFSNRSMTVAIIITVILQMATIYIPALNPIFKTEPLDMAELAICVGAAGIVLIAVEIEKWLVRREWIYQSNP